MDMETVLFTEDDWKTFYEGCVIENTIYSYRIRSDVYGVFYIAKKNVIINI